jgi:hypothetical protein
MPRNQAAKKAAPQEPVVEQPKQAMKPKPLRKVVPVRSRRGDTESSDFKAGQDTPRAMRSRGPARESLEPARIQPVGRVVSKEKLDALKFNEDVLTIVVHDSTNPLDDPMPEVWNDGTPQRFQRGKEMQVKRKYVEVLARAKKTTYTQRKVKNQLGEETYINVPHSALKYPFAVIHDPSPNGKAWLQSIINEA